MEPTSTDLVAARIESRQMSIGGRSVDDICSQVRMDRAEVGRLRRDRLISFDPDNVQSLDESQAAELIFLGSLVVAGCSRTLLRGLLRHLKRPYCYEIDRIYYDWQRERWQLRLVEEDPEGAFFELLERLRDRNHQQALKKIQGWLDEALDVERDQISIFHHSGEMRH